MQMINLENWAKSHRPAAMLPQSVEIPESIDDAADMDNARRALGEAGLIIREQAERIRKLESLALTDELTGLMNRRGLLLTLEREMAAARRDRAAQGILVMIDLDGFKSVNDQWGHAVGDDYLRTAARVLEKAVRASDLVARLGGDEFALLMPRVTELAAIPRVSDIERDFNCYVMDTNSLPVRLRGSFGFASYTGHETPEMVMSSADLKLYAHKAQRAKKKPA